MAFAGRSYVMPRGYGVWSYRTSDTTATMLVAGYFSPAYDMFESGDRIFVATVTGDVDNAIAPWVSSATLVVTAITSNGAVTVAEQVAGTIDHSTLTNLTVGDPHTQYVLAAGDTMTGTLNTRALTPTLTASYDLGTTTLRYKTMYGSTINTVKTDGLGGAFTANLSDTGVAFIVNTGVGNSTRLFDIDAGSLVPNFTYGYIYADTGASNEIENLSPAFVFGAVVTYSAEPGTTAKIGSGESGIGAFCSGYVFTGSNVGLGVNTFDMRADGPGSFCSGEIGADSVGGCTANIRADGGGAFAAGYVVLLADSISGDIQATSTGSFAHGGVTRGRIRASAEGAFASGYVSASSNAAGLLASGIGSIALGHVAANGTISATNTGSLAAGATVSSGATTASGLGAFAFAYVSSTTSCVASATNSVQFGPGTNAQAASLQVGIAGSGIAIKGTTGAFTSTANGQIYVGGSGNVFTTIHSNAKAVQIHLGQTYVTNTFTPRRTLPSSSTVTLAEVADTLATLIADFRTANHLN